MHYSMQMATLLYSVRGVSDASLKSSSDGGGEGGGDGGGDIPGDATALTCENT